MESAHLINGAAILLTFYVGYKYGLKVISKSAGSTNKKEEGTASGDFKKSNKFQQKKKPKSNENHLNLKLPIKSSKLKPKNDNKERGTNYKMVIVVRNDLKMGKGKIAAQCAHAAISAYQSALKENPIAVKEWEYNGSAKIVVQVDSPAELLDIRTNCLFEHVNSAIITDAGKTQIQPNTMTVLAVGPTTSNILDKLTGHLRLL